MIQFWTEKKNRGWMRTMAMVLAVSFLFTLVATPYAQAPEGNWGQSPISEKNRELSLFPKSASLSKEQHQMMAQYLKNLESLEKRTNDKDAKENLDSVLNLLKNNLFYAGPVKKNGKEYLLFTYWSGMEAVPFLLEFERAPKNGALSSEEFEKALKTVVWKLRARDQGMSGEFKSLPLALRILSGFWFNPSQFSRIFVNDPSKVREMFGTQYALERIPVGGVEKWREWGKRLTSVMDSRNGFFGLLLLAMVPFAAAYFLGEHSHRTVAEPLFQISEWAPLAGLSLKLRKKRQELLRDVLRDKLTVSIAVASLTEMENKDKLKLTETGEKELLIPTNFDAVVRNLMKKGHDALPHLKRWIDGSIERKNFDKYLDYKMNLNKYLPHIKKWGFISVRAILRQLDEITVRNNHRINVLKELENLNYQKWIVKRDMSFLESSDSMEDIAKQFEDFKVELREVQEAIDQLESHYKKDKSFIADSKKFIKISGLLSAIHEVEQLRFSMPHPKWLLDEKDEDGRARGKAEEEKWKKCIHFLKNPGFFGAIAHVIYEEEVDIEYSRKLAQYLYDWGANDSAIYAGLLYRLWQKSLNHEAGAEERLDELKKLLAIQKPYQEIERLLNRLEVVLKIPYRPKRRGREDIVNNQLKLILQAATGGEKYSRTLLPQVLLMAFADRLIQLEDRPGEGRFHSELQLQVRHLYAPLADMVHREGIALRFWEAIEKNLYGIEAYNEWKKNFKFEKFGFLREEVKEWLDSEKIPYKAVTMRTKHPISGKYKVLRKGTPKNKEQGDLVSDGVSITIVLPTQEEVDKCWSREKYEVEHFPDPDDPNEVLTWSSKLNLKFPHVGLVLNGGRKNGARIWTVEENIKINNKKEERFRYLNLIADGIEIKILSEKDWKGMNEGDSPHWVYKLKQNLKVWGEFKTEQKFNFKVLEYTDNYIKNCKSVFQSILGETEEQYGLAYDEKDLSIVPEIFPKFKKVDTNIFTPINLSQPAVNLTSKAKSSLRGLNLKLLSSSKEGYLQVHKKEKAGKMRLHIDIPHNTSGILEEVLPHVLQIGDIQYVRAHSFDKGKKGEIEIVLAERGESPELKKRELKKIESIKRSSQDSMQSRIWESVKSIRVDLIGQRCPNLELEIADKLDWFNIVEMRPKENIGEEGFEKHLEEARSAMGVGTQGTVQKGNLIGYHLHIEIPEDITHADIEELLNSNNVYVLPETIRGKVRVNPRRLPIWDKKGALIRNSLKLNIPKNVEGAITKKDLAPEIEINGENPPALLDPQPKKSRAITGPLREKKGTGPLFSPEEVARRNPRSVDLVVNGGPNHVFEVIGRMRALRLQGFEFNSVQIEDEIIPNPDFESKEFLKLLENALSQPRIDENIYLQLAVWFMSWLPLIGEKRKLWLQEKAREYLVTLFLSNLEEKKLSVQIKADAFKISINIPNWAKAVGSLQKDEMENWVVKISESVPANIRIIYEKKLLDSGDTSAIRFFLELLNAGALTEDENAIRFLKEMAKDLKGAVSSFLGKEPYNGMEFSKMFYLSSSWAENAILKLLLESMGTDGTLAIKKKGVRMERWKRGEDRDWWRSLLPKEGDIVYVARRNEDRIDLGALNNKGWIGKPKVVDWNEVGTQVRKKLEREGEYRGSKKRSGKKEVVSPTLVEQKMFDQLARLVLSHCDKKGSDSPGRIERKKVIRLYVVSVGAVDDTILDFKEKLFAALRMDEVFESLKEEDIEVISMLRLESGNYLQSQMDTPKHGLFLHLGEEVEGAVVGVPRRDYPYLGEIAVRIVRNSTGGFNYRTSPENKVNPKLKQREKTLSEWFHPESIAQRYYEFLSANEKTVFSVTSVISGNLHSSRSFNLVNMLFNKMSAGKLPGVFGDMMRSAIQKVKELGGLSLLTYSDPEREFTHGDLAMIYGLEPRVFPFFIEIFQDNYLPQVAIRAEGKIELIRGKIEEEISRITKEYFPNFGLENSILHSIYKEKELVDTPDTYFMSRFKVLRKEGFFGAALESDIELLEELAALNSMTDRINRKQMGYISAYAMWELMHIALQAGGADYDKAYDLMLHAENPLVREEMLKILAKSRLSENQSLFSLDQVSSIIDYFMSLNPRDFFYFIRHHAAEFKHIMTTVVPRDTSIGELSRDYKLIMDLAANAQSSEPIDYIGKEWDGNFPRTFRGFLFYLDHRSRNAENIQYKAIYLEQLVWISELINLDQDVYLQYKQGMNDIFALLNFLPNMKEKTLFQLIQEMKLEKDSTFHLVVNSVMARIQNSVKKNLWGNLVEAVRRFHGNGQERENKMNLFWFVPFLLVGPLAESAGAIDWQGIAQSHGFSVDWWAVAISALLLKPFKFLSLGRSEAIRKSNFKVGTLDLVTSPQEELTSAIAQIEKYTGVSYSKNTLLDEEGTSEIRKEAILLIDLNDFIETKKENSELIVNHIPAVRAVIERAKRALNERKGLSLGIALDREDKIIEEVLSNLNMSLECKYVIQQPSQLLPYLNAGKEVEVYSINGTRWSNLRDKVQLNILENIREKMRLGQKAGEWFRFHKLFSQSA